MAAACPLTIHSGVQKYQLLMYPPAILLWIVQSTSRTRQFQFWRCCGGIVQEDDIVDNNSEKCHFLPLSVRFPR
jgi:hypothetical protein